MSTHHISCCHPPLIHPHGADEFITNVYGCLSRRVKIYFAWSLLFRFMNWRARFLVVVLSFYIMILLTSNLNGYCTERWFGKRHIILQEIKHLRKRCSELELNLFCRKLKMIWHLSFWIRSNVLFQLHFN